MSSPRAENVLALSASSLTSIDSHDAIAAQVISAVVADAAVTTVAIAAAAARPATPIWNGSEFVTPPIYTFNPLDAEAANLHIHTVATAATDELPKPKTPQLRSMPRPKPEITGATALTTLVTSVSSIDSRDPSTFKAYNPRTGSGLFTVAVEGETFFAEEPLPPTSTDAKLAASLKVAKEKETAARVIAALKAAKEKEAAAQAIAAEAVELLTDSSPDELQEDLEEAIETPMFGSTLGFSQILKRKSEAAATEQSKAANDKKEKADCKLKFGA